MKSIEEVLNYIFEHEYEDYIEFLKQEFPDDADYIDECNREGNVDSLDKYAWNSDKELQHIYANAVKAYRSLHSGDGEALPVFVRFEHGQEDRVSKIYGPFEYAQIKYAEIRVKPFGGEEYELAYFDGLWVDNDKVAWSDVIF